MKTVITAASVVVKVLSLVAALAASPVVQMIPENYMWVAAITFGIVSCTKDFVVSVVDMLDDGKANQSFKG